MDGLKNKLVNKLIGKIIANSGDTTILTEILEKCDSQLLIHSLPEDERKEFENLQVSNYNKEQTHKRVLEEMGFYTSNLWNIHDVKGTFECTDEQAQEVLDSAMNNEATNDQIWFAINMTGDDMGLKRIETEE